MATPPNLHVQLLHHNRSTTIAKQVLLREIWNLSVVHHVRSLCL